MSEKTTWEQFFDAHAPIYESNEFTKNTRSEVSFLLEELQLQPGSSVLDVGCGTGRHSIELARRGYKVTGLDLDEIEIMVVARKTGEQRPQGGVQRHG